MTALATNYRTYDLPWTQGDLEERRFRRLMFVGVLLWLLLMLS